MSKVRAVNESLESRTVMESLKGQTEDIAEMANSNVLLLIHFFAFS